MSVWTWVGVVVVILVVIGLVMSLKVVQQYQQGVLFRLGRVIGVREPGLRLTPMTPIAVPLLIRGEYIRLRMPRARAVSVNGKSGWTSVSGISTVSPACANAKFGLPAIGHGNRLFSNSSAAGLIGVNVAR